MKCNVIKDLLPSYTDGICSEDTVKVVKEHLSNCEECKNDLTMMKSNYVEQIPEQVINPINPFKKVNKKRRAQVITAIIVTFILTVLGSFVIQEVGVVKQTFFPMASANVVINSENNKEEWKELYFGDDKSLEYDSIFWKKEIINHANNKNEIILRIKDEKGEIIINELKIPPGTNVKLEKLKRNEKYFFEIKNMNDGLYLINAT